VVRGLTSQMRPSLSNYQKNFTRNDVVCLMNRMRNIASAGNFGVARAQGEFNVKAGTHWL
ncbi:MAG TPA: hypothetical protein VGO47_07940, partial [Chlamydiales bacterium]|nr:hypothetical protein [Chlamydiales bacterium]